MTRRSRRSAANNCAHAGADASQTVGLAGDHRTRGFPSHADGLGSVSSYALSQPNSIVTSSGGRDTLGHGGQQANFHIVSAWLKPLRVAEAPQASKKDVVTKMPIRQSTQQHLLRTDSPIAQAKPALKSGKKAGKKAEKKAKKKTEKKAEKKVEKKAEKKKRKPFYKEVKKEIRGPAYWKKKAEEDARLLNIARRIWGHAVGKKAAEYRRRIVAKKCKRRRRVSRKWMEKKEGNNREARHKKQDQKQFFVNFNKAYEDKLRIGKCCIFERTLGHFTIAAS
ncbi:hypothetical protein DFJ58DRAFT_278908 [Suillus subalutaceus]|uniref:uncharacterized protein n=1 Tax=Suillus subalutaceus TaxID=48586 RepID=UPI001B86D237|nr:uncharacterized protein DFJ58DRAFT_278908 [Suillus subalutaceus]KAG1860137.1 hypothetical protein DFJ58DRAFT_278908 [Suillus subalutaceus]